MSGLPRPAARSSRLAMALTVAAVLASVPAVAQQAPDLEMLEYLGSWQTDDGSAVDPFHLDEMKELAPELERAGAKAETGEPARKKLEDRANENRRARKQEPVSSVEKDARRRDASPGGGHD